MTANALPQILIDETVQEEATAVLATMGLTVSDAVKLLLTRIAREHKLPFDPAISMEEAANASETPKIRQGWAEASRKIVEAGDVALVWPEFGNENDEQWQW